jgi:hypothetical protein
MVSGSARVPERTRPPEAPSPTASFSEYLSGGRREPDVPVLNIARMSLPAYLRRAGHPQRVIEEIAAQLADRIDLDRDATTMTAMA